ncbi:hypothetical protein [Streptomyces nigrescens]|uniref:hypothetical protein n=1 Tax=Streptomyces nigrescens TaxID=1920 RepID=UPI0021C40D5D|nr:hypothetical protein [Streptomyces nigrescens]
MTHNLTVGAEGRVRNAVHPGATIAGIMSQARAEAVHDTHTAEDKEFNDHVDAVNRAVSKGILIGTGSIPATSPATLRATASEKSKTKS